MTYQNECSYWRYITQNWTELLKEGKMAREEKYDLESEGSISMDGNYASNRIQIEVV